MKIKRFILFISLILFLAVFGCPDGFAGEWSKQSAEKTADAAITTSGGLFHGIAVITDATNSVTVSIYDNATAASGTELIPTWIVTTSARDRIQAYSINPPVRYYNGVYVDITTSGTVTYMVYFESN